MKSFYIDINYLDSLRVFWYFGTNKATEIEERQERQEKQNNEIFFKYFNLLQDEKISCFYTSTTNRNYKAVEAYHRSPKKDGYIQKSCFYIDRGQLVPVMDSQYQTAADAIRDGIKAGAYIIK